MAAMPNHPDQRVRPFDFYDAIVLMLAGASSKPVQSFMRLFGNAHVGSTMLCNMQVGQMLCCDQDSNIEQVRARTNLNTEARWFREWAATTYATLTIGDMSRMTWSIQDLLTKPPLRHPGRDFTCRCGASIENERNAAINKTFMVPWRQNVSVSIESSPPATERLMEQIRRDGRYDDALVWIHLEGSATAYHDRRPHDVDGEATYASYCRNTRNPPIK